MRRVWDSLPFGFTRGVSARSYSSKRTHARQALRDTTVVELATKNTRRTQRLYGFGFAATGALGIRSLLRPVRSRDITLPVVRHPMRLTSFAVNRQKVRSVGCGYGFTVFVCREEKGEWMLYGCGLNSESQLGFQKPCTKGQVKGHRVELVESPQPIPLPLTLIEENIPEDVSCGRAHTIFRTVGGRLYSLGNNCFGQCGREIVEGEHFQDSSIVSRIHIDHEDGDDRVVDVVCGQDHSLVLTKKGHVFSFGLGSDGQLGLGHFDNVWRPSRVKGALENKSVRNIACRGDTVLATCDNGHLYGWGNSEYNQLSTSEIQLCEPLRLFEDVDLGHVTQVAAAGSVCAALNSDGEVFVWGFGALGHGPRVSMLSKPKMLPTPLFGANDYDPKCRVVSIASGLHNLFAVNNRGVLYSWGSNRSGCLGLPQSEDQSFPLRVAVPAEVMSVKCGVDHMIILTKAFA